MSKKKLGIFLSCILSAVFCLQVIANSTEYQEEQWRKQGIDFHRIESEESAEIVDRYFIEDEDENVVSHEVMVAKDGTQYHNTSTLISSYVEYTDEDGNVIEVIDYVNPDYADHANANNARNVKNSPKITYSEFDTPIKSIDDMENRAQYIIKGKVLENSKNVLTPEGGGYTETDLEITDVYKGDLEIGNMITLVELYYTSQDGIEVRRDGYSASVPGEEYLFYIDTQYNDGTYGMLCNIFGRYSLEDTQVLNEEVDSIEANIVEEYLPLYNQLKEEVMEKYNKN